MGRQLMKLRAFALTLMITFGSSLAAAQPAPAPAPEPQPYPAPPPQPYPPQPQQYPQPYPPQPHPYPQPYAPPVPYAVPYSPPPAAELDGPKSSGTAVALSLGATFLPPLLLGAIANDDDASSDSDDDFIIGLLLTSATLGPSAGHIYAGNFMTIGLGIRVASLAIIMVGMSSDNREDEVGAYVGGTLGMIAGGIVDFAQLGRSVRDYNFDYHAKRLSPAVTPVRGADGSTGMTFGLNGNF